MIQASPELINKRLYQNGQLYGQVAMFAYDFKSVFVSLKQGGGEWITIDKLYEGFWWRDRV